MKTGGALRLAPTVIDEPICKPQQAILCLNITISDHQNNVKIWQRNIHIQKVLFMKL